MPQTTVNQTILITALTLLSITATMPSLPLVVTCCLWSEMALLLLDLITSIVYAFPK